MTESYSSATQSLSHHLGRQVRGTLIALDGDPADNAVLLSSTPYPHDANLAVLYRAFQKLHRLPDLNTSQRLRRLGIQCIVNDRAVAAFVVRSPWLHELFLEGDPAHSAVAQRPALHAHYSVGLLINWSLDYLHRLAFSEVPHKLPVLAGEALLEGRVPEHAVVLAALLRKDRASISPQRYPASGPVLGGLASDTHDSRILAARA
mmetsp:Transcript_18882/g.41220  ORF Transcript_18882/g.41220 Transcript_18882/m.41220 type:complete len:205 (-) Transcript_18882:5039-5653(-)